MGRQIVTAETDEGRRAIAEVMRASYQAEIDDVPPEWARALVVDGVPVSFILVDPNEALLLPGGKLRSAFISDVATRGDRRGEGHFRAILELTFADLRAAGISVVTTHGEADLYRRFGFGVYTHHLAWFLTPELVARQLGVGVCDGWERLADLNEHPHLRRDLLLFTGAWADTLAEAAALLRTAAALAEERGKPEIAIMPGTPSLESRHCPFVDSPLTEMVLACGGKLVLQGADPEGRPIAHADWIKALDVQEFLRQTVDLGCAKPTGLPRAAVQFETEAGSVTLRSSGHGPEVLGSVSGAVTLGWPACAVVELALGQKPAGVLAEIHRTPLPEDVAQLLDALFPKQWRLSVNESWIFRS
jgi:hypothetical protein